MHIVCDMLRGPGVRRRSRRRRPARASTSAPAGSSARWSPTTRRCMSVKQVTHRPHPLRDGRRAAARPPSSTAGCSGRPCTRRSTPSRTCRAAFHEMHENTQTGIPIIRIAEDMPAAVKGLRHDRDAHRDRPRGHRRPRPRSCHRLLRGHFGADRRAPRDRRVRRRRGGPHQGGRLLHPAAHADPRRLAGRQVPGEARRGHPPHRLPRDRLRGGPRSP